MCMTRGVKVKEYSKQFLSEHLIFEVELVIQAEQFSIKITNTKFQNFLINLNVDPYKVLRNICLSYGSIFKVLILEIFV